MAIGKDAKLLYRVMRYRALPWLPAYFRDYRNKRRQIDATDLIVCVADHYEPAKADGDNAYQSVRRWVEAYSDGTAGIIDSDGAKPKHTWFYRFDFPDDRCVQELALATWEGLGEIEFHLHHGNDDESSFRARLRQGLELGARYGAMLNHNACSSFGYIAGNWALNNSAGVPEWSGCNSEIRILREEGCYGDFTYPALGSPAQPRRVNSLYYAPPLEGKQALERGSDVAVGVSEPGDGLLMVQGPLTLSRSVGTIEYAAVEAFAPYESWRIPEWVRAGVVVRGRPEWRFIKLHTHGMQSRSEYCGSSIAAFYGDLVAYTQRCGMRVHFVSARELVNILHAAEAGEAGDAGRFRNAFLPPPPNAIVRASAPMVVSEYAPDRLVVRFDTPLPELSVILGGVAVRCHAQVVHMAELQTSSHPVLVLYGRGPGGVRLGEGPERPLSFMDGRATVVPLD